MIYQPTTTGSADDEYARIGLMLLDKHARHIGLEQHGRVKTLSESDAN